MPHVVLSHSIDLQQISQSFEKISVFKPYLIKIQKIFVDNENQTALLPVIAIDEYNQQFLIEIKASHTKTTIRLYPGTDPRKTPAVFTSLGIVAKHVCLLFPHLKVVKTNISEFIA